MLFTQYISRTLTKKNFHNFNRFVLIHSLFSKIIPNRWKRSHQACGLPMLVFCDHFLLGCIRLFYANVIVSTWNPFQPTDHQLRVANCLSWHQKRSFTLDQKKFYRKSVLRVKKSLAKWIISVWQRHPTGIFITTVSTSIQKCLTSAHDAVWFHFSGTCSVATYSTELNCS